VVMVPVTMVQTIPNRGTTPITTEISSIIGASAFLDPTAISSLIASTSALKPPARK